MRVAAQRHGLSANQVVRVLRICGAIAPRARRAFRHRGTTEQLSPGALLVTDGKTLDVELTGSRRRTTKNWQGIVDQATACDTAAVVTNRENADAVCRAYVESVAFLGDVPPAGLLHDNRTLYETTKFRDEVGSETVLVAATPARPENKALLEGEFSLFERRVGTIVLDDSSTVSLIHSAVSEVVRAYTAATNAVPRAELGGRSREAALRSARPSKAKKAADLAFIGGLKARHERERRSNWRARMRPGSRRLLDHVFAMLDLEDRDPSGGLRRYLSIYDQAAIRPAAVIVRTGLDRGHVKRLHAHRYLVKVIQSTQECIDLHRQEAQLLELCRLEAQDWVRIESAECEELQRKYDAPTLARKLAEQAAWGGLPVRGAFWTEKLLELLEFAPDLADSVRSVVVRLYEAPAYRRLWLLDRIAAWQEGVI